MRKIINSAWTSAVVFISSAAPVLAATETINLKPTGGDFPKLTELTVANLISGLIKLTVIIAAVVFFFWLVLGGIKWIMSGGDKTKTEEARNQITAALIGLVIVFSAWAITQLIKVLFGFDLFNLTITQLGQ